MGHPHLDEPVSKVTRTSTENEIRETERKVLQPYGVKAEMKVIDRNSREITNLTYVRYDKQGKEAGSCSSDNFGLLIITRMGYKIAYSGQEKEI